MREGCPGSGLPIDVGALAEGSLGLHPDLAPERLLDALPQFALLVDSEHRILYANRAVQEALAVDATALLGAYCPRAIHGLDDPYPGCPLETSVSGGDCPCTTELHIPEHGRWIESAVYPTEARTTHGGRIFVHLASDITARKTAEADVEEHLRVQAVLDRMLQISLEELDLETQMGRLLDEILSLPWLDVQKRGAILAIDPETGGLSMVAQRGLAPRVRKACRAVPLGRCLCGLAARTGEVVFAQGLDDRHEVRYDEMEPHGHYCVPIRARGGVVGVLNVYLDDGSLREPRDERFLTAATDVIAGILERHRARAGTDLLRVLLQRASDSILVVHPGTGRLVDFNDAACTRLGYTREEMLLLPITSIQDTVPDAAGWKAHVRQLRRQGTLVLEGGHRCKDGSSLPMDSSVGLVEVHGQEYLVSVSRDATERREQKAALERSLLRLQTALTTTVAAMTRTVEMKDPYTAGHQTRVAALAVAIATEMGLDARRVEGLRIAGLLHDLGKICVPTELLVKPTRLSAPEFRLIQGHSQAGYDILKDIDFPWPVANVVLQHHERLDGSGYPQGSKGDEILLEARILAVADTVEAMASHRPYRPALGIPAALEVLREQRGIGYDAAAVDACLALFQEDRFRLP